MLQHTSHNSLYIIKRVLKPIYLKMYCLYCTVCPILTIVLIYIYIVSSRNMLSMSSILLICRGLLIRNPSYCDSPHRGTRASAQYHIILTGSLCIVIVFLSLVHIKRFINPICLKKCDSITTAYCPEWNKTTAGAEAWNYVARSSLKSDQATIFAQSSVIAESIIYSILSQLMCYQISLRITIGHGNIIPPYPYQFGKLIRIVIL